MTEPQTSTASTSQRLSPPSRELIPCPPDLVQGVRLALSRFGEPRGSSLSADERRGRLMLATSVARNCTEHQPPKWPAPLGIPWGAVEQVMREPEAHGSAAATFGEHRFAVTQAEAQAAASVCVLLRAWRELLNLCGEEREQYEPIARRLRVYLARHWSIRLAEPPKLGDCDRVASRLTRRYDLLPRDARAW
jgi:hypothetical protein